MSAQAEAKHHGYVAVKRHVQGGLAIGNETERPWKIGTGETSPSARSVHCTLPSENQKNICEYMIDEIYLPKLK